MAESYLPRCGAIPISSVRDLNLPIITYVGRLSASQKGYDTLLEALNLLSSIDLVPFCVWIVGGAGHELRKLNDEIDRAAGPKRLRREGRLTMWGRIDYEALAEIYARSSLVVMPSRRETFGLVAIQAMSCGAPVAASHVGGLKNTVIHGRTGAHFQPGDARALAFLIANYVRNKALVRDQGRMARLWASYAFGEVSPHSGLSKIISAQNGDRASPHPIENGRAALECLEFDRHLDSDHGHECYRIKAADAGFNNLFRLTGGEAGERVVKVFREFRDMDASIFALMPPLRPIDAATRVHRTLLAACSPFAVDVERCGEHVVSMTLASPCAREVDPAAAIDLAHSFAGSLPPPDPDAVAACLECRTLLAADPGWDGLGAFDHSAARLNRPYLRADDQFVRCDPYVELIRYDLHLNRSFWPLPPAMAQAFSALVQRALGQLSSRPAAPRGRHGDFALRHILDDRGTLVLCDFEDTRITFGDIDLASLFTRFRKSGGGRTIAVDEISSLVDGDSTERDAVIAWSLAHSLYLGLSEAFWGDLGWLQQALDDGRAILGEADR